jgi:hypothetical protein
VPPVTAQHQCDPPPLKPGQGFGCQCGRNFGVVATAPGAPLPPAPEGAYAPNPLQVDPPLEEPRALVNVGGLVAAVADAFKGFADCLGHTATIADAQAATYRLAAVLGEAALAFGQVELAVPSHLVQEGPAPS